MKRLVVLAALLAIVIVLAGCGQSGQGTTALTQSGVAEGFTADLFANRMDKAKAWAAKGHADELKASVDAFAPLLDKYEFTEVKVTTYSPWGTTADLEGDKKAVVNFQYKSKGGGDIKIGFVDVHLLSIEGAWGVSEVIARRPSD